MFGFQKLDVSHCAETFLGLATSLVNKPPRGYSALSDKLRMASLSIPLNIAESVKAAEWLDRIVAMLTRMIQK